MAHRRPTLTLKLPNREMHERLKRVAAARRQTVSGVVREAIGEWLESNKPSK